MENAVKEAAYQKCIRQSCGAEFGIRETLFACPKCGELLDVRYRWEQTGVPKSLSFFEQRWAERTAEITTGPASR